MDDFSSLAEFTQAYPERRKKQTRVACIMDKVIGNAGHPNRLITFDTETRPLTCREFTGINPYECPACMRTKNLTHSGDDEIQDLVMACATFSDLKRGQFEKEFFTSVDEFWDWVETKAIKKMVTWIVNHNINFDLMVMRFNTALVERDWTTRTLVLPDPSGPTMMEWTKEGMTIKFVNLANWWGMRPLKSIGAVLGEYKGDLDPTDPKYRHAPVDSADYQKMVDYCHQDAYVVVKAVVEWVKFCKDNDLGTFSMTQAGQSLTAFRHRFMTHEIYLHDNVDVLLLERLSYKGARTECFWVGTAVAPIGELFFYLDVNSLYPSVMLTHMYPCRMTGHMRYNGENGLIDLVELLAMEDVCITARVQLRISTEEQRVIAHRGESGRLLYPLGQFTEVLTTRELRLAMKRGSVVSVSDIVTYDAAPLFTSYVEFFYRLRQQHKQSGNLIFTEIVKVFLNSLYGKFGQHVREWDDAYIEGLQEGITSVLDADTGEFKTYRNLGGRVEERSATFTESRYSFSAIAAHITADARLKITHMHEIAGDGNSYYCDTDSLFTNRTGYTRLVEAGMVDETTLGMMKLEQTADKMRITTLKDYEFGTYIKRKGMRRDAIQNMEADGTPIKGSYRQVQFRGLSGALRENDPNTARVGVAQRVFTGAYNKGTVGADGWVKPILVQEW